MRSLRRAMALLDVLERSPHNRASLGALSRAAALPAGTVHRLLRCFLEHGFVEQVEPSGQYQIGIRLVQFGLRVRDNLDVRQVVLPYMEELTEQSRETTYLWVPDGFHGVLIEKVDGSQTVRFFEVLGARIPLHAGCSRKVLLAYMPEDTLDGMKNAGLLQPRTPLTVTDIAVLRAQLALIRAQGYAISYGENVQGAAGIAIPLRDWRDQVVASLSIAIPQERVTEQRAADLTQHLVQVGSKICYELGSRSAQSR